MSSLNIVVQTGNSDPDVHRACFKFGASSVFVKGQPIAEFLRLLNFPCKEVASC